MTTVYMAIGGGHGVEVMPPLQHCIDHLVREYPKETEKGGKLVVRQLVSVT